MSSDEEVIIKGKNREYKTTKKLIKIAAETLESLLQITDIKAPTRTPEDEIIVAKLLEDGDTEYKIFDYPPTRPLYILNPPATGDDFDKLQESLPDDAIIPPDFIALYSIHNGQNNSNLGYVSSLLPNGEWLSIDDIVDEKRVWDELILDNTFDHVEPYTGPERKRLPPSKENVTITFDYLGLPIDNNDDTDDNDNDDEGPYEWWSLYWFPISRDGGGNNDCISTRLNPPHESGRSHTYEYGTLLFMDHECGPSYNQCNNLLSYFITYKNDVEAETIKWDSHMYQFIEE